MYIFFLNLYYFKTFPTYLINTYSCTSSLWSSWQMSLVWSNMIKVINHQGFHAQNLEISSKRITRVGDTHTEKSSVFLEIFASMKQNSHFWKIRQFSCNAGRFLSARGNFMLLTRSDRFLILPRIECSSIQKSEI